MHLFVFPTAGRFCLCETEERAEIQGQLSKQNQAETGPPFMTEPQETLCHTGLPERPEEGLWTHPVSLNLNPSLLVELGEEVAS